ncbi:hypothetical protein [Methylobacterium sp. ID0610]|uniref:hypothetical protein n=1 Tax=Methylobacterium carpenticola TaxID=3344827 RepID=UPI0036BC5CE1
MATSSEDGSREQAVGETGHSGPSDIPASRNAARSAARERPVVAQHFDTGYYLAQNPDVAEAGRDPLEHFLEYGWREGRSPAPWFDIDQYLAQHPEVAEADVNPFHHFLLTLEKAAPAEPLPGPAEDVRAPDEDAQAVERGIVAPYFDPAYYLACNPDVMRAGTDPLSHFLDYGWREGRSPAPWFNIEQYLSHRPDIRHAGINPFYYYLLERRQTGGGRKVRPDEGGSPAESPQRAFERAVIAPYFDRAYYTETYTDVAMSGVDPLEHFLTIGWREGRNPDSRFDVTEYLRLNPDVEAAGFNPLYHYLVTGKAEGRPVRSRHSAEIKLIASAQPMGDRARRDLAKPSHRAALSAASLRAALGRLLPAHRDRFVIGLSHDEYTRTYGGVQICIGQEQSEANARGLSYVHIAPARPVLAFRHDQDSDDLVTLTVDGERVGHARHDDVIASLGGRIVEAGKACDLVIHSVLGFSLRFILDLHGSLRPRRTTMWAHDGSTLCTNYALLRNDVEFCWAPEIGSSACRVCAYGTERAGHVAAMTRLIDAVKPTMLFPSDTMREFWESRSPYATTGASVLPHATARFTAERRRTSVTSPLRIAFVGIAAPHKGWHVFHDLAESHRDDPRYRFLHFATEPGAKTPVIAFRETSVTPQQPNAMIEALREEEIDVVLQWSLCFETFSFSTLEAILAGTFVIARSESGNAAKLVTDHDAGLLLADKAALADLFATGAALDRVRQYRAKSIPVGELQPNTASLLAICGAEAEYV